MSEGAGLSPDDERRLRNLQAVARHLAQGPPVGNQPAPAAAGGAAPPARAWGRWGSVGVVLAFLAGKLKLLIPLLKLAKLPTLLSMLLSVWVYGRMWGAAFALGFVLLIFVHELGHVLVMRRQGIPAGAPVFIPFVGAVIAMKGLPRDAWIESTVGIGGPLLGSAGALACLLVGWSTHSPFWYALAHTGFLINLFNMIPISPLDGGRIVGVISRWLWVAGYAVGIAVFLTTHHPLLLVILVLGLFEVARSFRARHAGYYAVAPGRRLAMAAAYFGLVALLAVGMWATGLRLDALAPPG